MLKYPGMQPIGCPIFGSINSRCNHERIRRPVEVFEETRGYDLEVESTQGQEGQVVTRHAVDDPDPLCEGDDPCVCEQLIEARRQAVRDCIAIMEVAPDAYDALAAMRALRENS
jgi:hypothetical protein